MQWITVAKIQRNFIVFKTFLAGIMILYLLTWRASSAGDGTETLSFRYWCGDLEVESVMIVVLYSSLPLWSGSSQTYPSLVTCFLMLLLVTVTSAGTDTHSYNSNLEIGLRVFNCYSC